MFQEAGNIVEQAVEMKIEPELFILIFSCPS